MAWGVRAFMYSARERVDRSGILVLVLLEGVRRSCWVVVMESWVVWVWPISIKWTCSLLLVLGSVWDSMAAFV